MDATTAQMLVARDLVASGLVARVECAQTSDELYAPLVRPFHAVVFVASGGQAGESTQGPVLGFRIIDDASARIESFGTHRPKQTRTATDLCTGLHLDAELRTTTRLPPHL
jgi:hypothetical protein